MQPRLVERGTATELVVELPVLRPGAPPERLELEGRGVEVLSSGLRGVVGSETRWTVRLRADTTPGTVSLVLRAVYADGKSVSVEDSLTVVPAAKGDPFPWAAAGVGTALALTAAAAVLVVARRRSW